MPYLLDGRPISLDVAFTHNDIQYPANWIRLASEDEKAAIGLTWQADPPSYDQRFAWGYAQDGTLLWKDHAQLVEQWVSQTKATAGTLLAATDWMVTRSAEPGGKPVADAVLAERAAIRAKSDAKEAAIEATSTSEELAAYITSPDYSTWFDAPPAADDASVDGLEFAVDGGSTGSMIAS